MQQFRLPILLSILVLSHIVHPVMAADETDSHPTATLTTDSEELSVQYPDILSLEWGIANQNNRLETYSVNLSVEDDRGLVIWDGPTQYWQFQPFESHTFRAPFRPADNLPAGVYPLVVSISEMSPEVSSSASMVPQSAQWQSKWMPLARPCSMKNRLMSEISSSPRTEYPIVSRLRSIRSKTRWL